MLSRVWTCFVVSYPEHPGVLAGIRFEWDLSRCRVHVSLRTCRDF